MKAHKGKIILAIVVLCAMYPFCFHGRREGLQLGRGDQLEVHWCERQYFLGMKMWETNWTEYEGTDKTPIPRGQQESLGATAYDWRGFGLLGFGPFRKERHTVWL